MNSIDFSLRPFRLAAAAILLSMPFPTRAQEDYSTWFNTRQVMFNTSATGAGIPSDQIGFPVLIRLDEAQSEVFSSAKTHGEDLRFSKAADGKHLPYEIESWDAAAKTAAIWVRVDTLKGNKDGQFILMHCGNANAADSSNGAAVFGGGGFDAGNGYSAVWHLGASLEDATGNTPAALDSGTTPAAGLIGPARKFTNTDAYAATGQYIAIGSPASLNIAGTITLEAWIKWQSKLNHRIVICHGSAASNSSETVLRVGEYQDYRTGIWNGKVHHAHKAAAAADSNTWVHIAGVYDGTKWTLYRNGVAVHDTADPGFGAQSSPAAWRIGAQWTSQGVQRFFHGDIDEVRLSKTARSADWLKLGYENQKENQGLVRIGIAGTSVFSTPRRRAQNPGFRHYGWKFHRRNVLGQTEKPANALPSR